MLDLFGYIREELMDLKVQELYVDPDKRSRFQQEIEQEGSLRNYEETRRRNRYGTCNGSRDRQRPWSIMNRQ